MKNLIIDEYFRRAKIEITDEVIQGVRQTMNNAAVLWHDLPTEGELAVIPHISYANYMPGHPLHIHDYFELIYVYSGSAVQYMENERLELEQGSLLLMNLYCRHGLAIESEDDAVFNILISRDILNASFLNSIREIEDLADFFMDSVYSSAKNGAYVYFQNNSSSRVEFLIQSMLEEYILCLPGFRPTMKAYLSIIFTELYRNHHYFSDRKTVEENSCAEILNYINDHLENVTLGMLAKHEHYSTTYMSGVIKRYFGRSFSEIVSDLRLEQAAQYLSTTNLNISSISDKLGYYDRSHFNRLFRKKYGMSPGDYRASRKSD